MTQSQIEREIVYLNKMVKGIKSLNDSMIQRNKNQDEITDLIQSTLEKRIENLQYQVTFLRSLILVLLSGLTTAVIINLIIFFT